MCVVVQLTRCNDDIWTKTAEKATLPFIAPVKINNTDSRIICENNDTNNNNNNDTSNVIRTPADHRLLEEHTLSPVSSRVLWKDVTVQLSSTSPKSPHKQKRKENPNADPFD